MQSSGSEVVRVANRAFLAGPGMQAAGDAKSNGMDLDPGFYLALSPKCGRSNRRRAWRRYFGPFPSPVEAKFLASSALAMGLIEPASSEPEPAALRPDFRSRQSLGELAGA